MDQELSPKLKGVKSQASFIRGLLPYFGDSDEKLKAILKGTDVSFAQYKLPNTLITGYNTATILKNINALQEPGWVFGHQDIWTRDNVGDVGLAAQSTPNLNDVIEVLVRYSHLEETSIYFERFDGAKAHRLSYWLAIDDPDVSRVVAEILSVIVFRFLGSISNRKLHDCEIWFSDPAPAYAHLYRQIFTGPVKFGKAYNAIILPKFYLELPSHKIDPKTYMLAMSRLSRRHSDDENSTKNRDDFVKGVAQYLTAFIEHRPDAESTAVAMSVSRRTMTRKLRSAGTSFSALLEEARKAHAYALKKQKIYTQAQIAEKLGYQDQTSFSRAWRRWEKKAQSQ